MNEAIDKLLKLQTELHSQKRGGVYEETLMFCQKNDFVHLYFFGMPNEESFDEVLKLLTTDIAEKVKSLEFDSPDEGANGTNNFDFSILAESDRQFPNLQKFAVKLTEPEDHNRTIIAQSYDEQGIIAKLIKKMPRLLSLQIPSAPDEDFFDLNSHSLEYLKLQVGYDTQNFIHNLSNSMCFPNLRNFDFTDFQETYSEGWQDSCTPLEDFKKFFSSPAFSPVKEMILRNVTYTSEQIKELKTFTKGTSFKFVRTESDYV